MAKRCKAVDKQRPGTEELKVTVPAELAAALDNFARSQGLSRAEAVRAVLCFAPEVESILTRGRVSARDVPGP